MPSRHATACPARLHDAQAALAKVKAIDTMVRERLLAILSEARTMSHGLDPTYRDPLIDELTSGFHPDQAAGDLLTDAVVPVRRVIEARIDELEVELGVEA